MKRKPFIIVLFTLLLCFNVVFATSAAQLSAKDLLIDKINNFKLGVNKDFYNKSSSDTSLVLNKFEGTVKNELGDYTGSKIGLKAQLDEPNKTIRINYDTKIKENARHGEIYLTDNKVILTKDVLSLLEDFDVNALKGSGFLKLSPQYLYFITDQLKPIWEQMSSYQNQQLPAEYKDLLLFFIEAVPDKYFTKSSSTITIQLKQDSFEDVIYSLVTKIVTEKERFADIIYNVGKYSFQTQGISPEEMKKQFISGIAGSPPPTMDQIHEMSKFIETNLTYTCSVLPNGPDKLDMNIEIKSPDEPIKGNINISSESRGGQDNLQGSYVVKGGFDDGNGVTFNGAITGNFKYKGTAGTSDVTINITSKNINTKELLFDIGVSVKSSAETDPNMVVKAPEINASNSMDITQFIPSPGTMSPSQDGILKLFVNGKNIDCDIMPNITDKGIILPIRFVSEALGYKVEWFNPNEVRITGNDKVISLFVGQETYMVNGEARQLDSAPYVEKDKRTMVLMDFITNELGADVNLSGGNIYITSE